MSKNTVHNYIKNFEEAGIIKDKNLRSEWENSGTNGIHSRQLEKGQR